MSQVTSRSYLSVAYDLRPAKQVERRMLLDFFRRLSSCGVAIEKFRYTGMGSIHFVDHILFHKFLGIDKLVSVERDLDIEKRIRFNKPFENIEIEMMPIGDYISRLDNDENHILWLDYDYRLSSSMIDDVIHAASHLPTRSFIIVTVDAEPHKDSGSSEDNMHYYEEHAKDLWDPSWAKGDFTNSKLHLRIVDILHRAFKDGVSGRPNASILPCLSYVYSDTHKMITMGVLIGQDLESGFLDQVQSSGANYLIRDFASPPFEINVPILTRKERIHLENVMPSGEYKKIKPLGIAKSEFDEFAKVYRFFPSYSELLMG